MREPLDPDTPLDIPELCPNCGKRDRYSTKVNAGGGYSPNFLPQLSTKWWSTPTLNVVTCASCGLTQFFAQKENREKLPRSSKWRRI